MIINTDTITIGTIVEIFSAVIIFIISWVSLKYSVNKLSTDTKKDITYLEDLIDKLNIEIIDIKKYHSTEHEKMVLLMDYKETKIIHTIEIELKKITDSIGKDIESGKTFYIKEIENIINQLNTLDKNSLGKITEITKRVSNIGKLCKELEISNINIINRVENIYKYDIPFITKMIEKKDT